jgi:PAS domain S-box-containing protein
MPALANKQLQSHAPALELASLRRSSSILPLVAQNCRQLATEHARLVSIVEATSDFVSFANLEGDALYVNPAGRQMVGMSADEPARKMRIFDYHPQWVRSLFSEALVIAAQNGVWQGESALLTRSGEEIPVSQVILAHEDENGDVEYFSTIARDISSQKVVEQERTQLLSMLTHDIKNPLTAIYGYVDLLTEELRGEKIAGTEELLLGIKSNVITINSLVGNYLDLTRLEARNLNLYRSPQCVANLLSRTTERYDAVRQRRRVNLTLDIVPGIPKVWADATALDRVFSNLIDNALKFTPEHGDIIIRARAGAKQTQEPTETCALPVPLSTATNAIIEVHNSGSGIAPKDMTSLFQKYYRATDTQQRDGLGLGLFIVKTLVEAHEGRIEVESQLGKGCCFRITLPSADPNRTTTSNGAVRP